MLLLRGCAKYANLPAATGWTASSCSKVETALSIAVVGVMLSPAVSNLNCCVSENSSNVSLKATEFLKKNGKNYKLPFTILRLYQIYGPYQTVDRLIPMVISKFLNVFKINKFDYV